MIERNTQLWLTGKIAYVKLYGYYIHKSLKSDFETLLNDDDLKITVYVNKNVAERYARRISKLGYVLKKNENFDNDTYKLTYEKLLHLNNFIN